MFAYQQEKIENAICYFAGEYQKRVRRPLSQTFLYKLLAFLEFKGLEETGKPVLGLTYCAMQWGPVPLEIYNKRENYETKLFAFISKGEDRIDIIARGKPDFDYFSEYEKEKPSS